MDAGHYVPKTSGLSLYFDERNVNAQCVGCNRYRHGNLSQYALGLVDKYGKNILNELEETRLQMRKYSSKEYMVLYDHYREQYLTLGGPPALLP
jgi:hypothetical protein